MGKNSGIAFSPKDNLHIKGVKNSQEYPQLKIQHPYRARY